MNDLRPVYLLAGGRDSRTYGDVVRAIVGQTGKKKPTIAYVGVASGENYGFYLMISSMIKNAASCAIKRVVIAGKNADINKAKQILESADAIFMSGGDVEAGMRVLTEKGLVQYFINLHQGGKVIFSASAGSIMLGRQWVRWENPDDDATAELFPCLGIVPIICDTHAEDDDWEELRTELMLDKEGTTGYGITSGSCLAVFPEGRLEAFHGTVVRFRREGNRLVRLPELTRA